MSADTGTGKSRNQQRYEQRITFWGVRGTLPTPGTETLHYGGNTSCVEVANFDHLKEKNVSLIDLTPTLCDLVGIEKDPTFKGKNLFNENASLVFHQSAFSEKEGHRLEIERLDQCRVACQFDNWKYILDHGTGKEELYNLSKDPKEKNNVF